MSRPLRIEFPGAVYHVMNRGAARHRVFLQRGDYEAFLKTLAEAYKLWGIEIFAYCLMPNHYHLCLRTPQANLSRVMRHVDGLYTQRFNRSHGRDGPLFRGRYKAILIDADHYLAGVIRYIHLNPIEGGLASTPDLYQWSSHRSYLRPSRAPDWLKVSNALDYFSELGDFDRFVLSGNDEELEGFYAGTRQSPLLGGERFRDKVMRYVRRLGSEHPRYDRLSFRPSMKNVIEAVAAVYRIKPNDLLSRRRGKENEPRKLAMYLIKRLCDSTLTEIAGRFGVRSYGTVGWACHGIQAKAHSEKRFLRQIEKLQAAICQPKT